MKTTMTSSANPDARHLPDNELWEKMKRGDSRSLEALFRSHFPFLYDYGLKLSGETELVKDSIHEVFACIWEGRQGLSATESVRAYLLVSLRRRIFDQLKRRERRRTVDRQFSEELHGQPGFCELEIFPEEEDDEVKQLWTVCEKIPPKMREALYLKIYNGLKYRDIAKIMHISPQVARNYVSQAYRKIRELYLLEESVT